MHGYSIDRILLLYKTIVVVTIYVFSLHSMNGQNKDNDSISYNNTSHAISYKDELDIGTQIEFNKKTYSLKWGVHPHPVYYKQEYYTKKGNIDSYKEKVSFEVILGNYHLNDALTIKINELDSLITQNPIIDYEVFNDKKNNQLIIDFISNKNAGYYEWSIHRYIKRHKPKEMLILFEYTYRRPYTTNKDILEFLTYIKKIRLDVIKKAYSFEIPKIKLKKQP